MSTVRRLDVLLLPPAALAVALAGVALARPAAVLAPTLPESAALAAVAIAAALHRPAPGGPLGFGTLALPAALVLLDAFWIGLSFTLAALAAEFLRRAFERRRAAPLPERRHLARVSAQASLAGLGALAAAAAWTLAAVDPAALTAPAVALVGAAYLTPAAAFEILARRRLRGEGVGEIASGLLPLGWELPGVAIGGLVAAVGVSAGWGLGGACLAATALLAAEAARQALGAEAAERNLAESARITRAGASLAAGGSELERLARRIFDECAGIVPFVHAELEISSPDGEPVLYSAGADADPEPGEADPPPYPPPLPGFHRREPWRLFDRTLLEEGDRRARLRLWCDPRRIEPSAEASFESLVPQMAASVRSALLDREATVDRLTGAATRRALERRLSEAFAAADDAGSSLALVIADLDHFKRINDRFGHAAGDAALRAVARVLVAPGRGRDFCGRFGGEEFVLVLEEASGELALEVAERLRARIEELRVDADGIELELTMSFGVAAYPELAVRTPEELLELADGALYTAKRLGRNLAVLDLGGGRMRTGAGGVVEVHEPPPARTPVFFA